jgi:hypothetical protein
MFMTTRPSVPLAWDLDIGEVTRQLGGR